MPEWFQKPPVSQAQRSARTRAFSRRPRLSSLLFSASQVSTLATSELVRLG
jgi:hypothetical protein